jgi:hypothetical protein
MDNKGNWLNCLSFHLISPESNSQEQMKPNCSHMFLAYTFYDKIQGKNEHLSKVQSPVKSSSRLFIQRAKHKS